MTGRLMVKHPITGFKMGLLSVLSWDKRQFWSIGAHPAHKRRALRELQEMGLVSSTWDDVWSITALGRAVYEADRDFDGTAAERLRAAEHAWEALCR